MEISKMDIQKTSTVKKRSWIKPAALILSALMFSAWQFTQASSDTRVSRSELRLSNKTDLANYSGAIATITLPLLPK